ncbi:MAG: DNA repair protein RadA [Patescibacteria group bacterium]|jgi:DNA repair protein RadA/Sms|nr:DNA repair protein RadA [Patescibacteria group bacterium]MDD5173112.1 DNA repair protein RadA [Patescibacteria group bacterium]
MSIFVCSKCDAQFPKWLGQCSQCGAWGTIMEKGEESTEIKNFNNQVIDFNQINQEKFFKIKTGLNEVDRVLGGGIVFESLILLGGQPGIGKSTLVLQIADKSANHPVFYVSGEESAQQVKTRMDRLNISSNNWKFLGESDINVIIASLKRFKPKVIIIDSIQTMVFPEIASEAGNINQVRACTSKLREIAQELKAVVFIIGHVTKEGVMAGPKTLEHLVDIVLYLEGDPSHRFRFLRAGKNRFGSTNEVGVFDMGQTGLMEVVNPSEIFLANRNAEISGSVVVPVVEGSRSFLVEVQALVSRTSFGYPQRKSTGFDLNRLGLLIAVLIKRCNFNLANQDIHINIVGGLQVREPAVDLGVGLAIASAFKNSPINPEIAVFGEVGLGGEIRGVKATEKRIKEAFKLGFKKIISPVGDFAETKIIQVKNLNEAIAQLC